eukprot:gene26914-biopygen17496
MELLLDRGAMIDHPARAGVPGHNGDNPLIMASENGHTKSMELLLDRGAK